MDGEKPEDMTERATTPAMLKKAPRPSIRKMSATVATVVATLASLVSGIASAAAPLFIQASNRINIVPDTVFNAAAVSALVIAGGVAVGATVFNLRLSLRRKSATPDPRRAWAGLVAVEVWGAARREG